MAKLKIEEIQAELEKDGWKVISDTYQNLDTQMEFECNEGHRVFAPYKKIRTKRECPVCKQNSLYAPSDKIVSKKKDKKRIIALDQATKVTGYAIYDGSELIKYGTFETTLNNEIARDNATKNWLLSMIQNWQPDGVAIEGIQFQDNLGGYSIGVTTFETLARLQGILMEACYEQGIKYEVYPTNTWRKGCGVKGRARTDKKRSMQLLAKQWHDVSLTEDEADAVGIGYYASKEMFKEVEVEDWE